MADRDERELERQANMGDMTAAEKLDLMRMRSSVTWQAVRCLDCPSLVGRSALCAACKGWGYLRVRVENLTPLQPKMQDRAGIGDYMCARPSPDAETFCTLAHGHAGEHRYSPLRLRPFETPLQDPSEPDPQDYPTAGI